MLRWRAQRPHFWAAGRTCRAPGRAEEQSRAARVDPPSVLLFESPTTHTTLTSPRRSTQPTHSTSDRPPMSVGADAAFARGLSQSQDGAPLDLPFTCPAADDAHRRDRRRVAAPLPTPQLSVRTCMTQRPSSIVSLSAFNPSRPYPSRRRRSRRSRRSPGPTQRWPPSSIPSSLTPSCLPSPAATRARRRRTGTRS